MPYIKPERREDLDPMVDALATKLREMNWYKGSPIV
jgi:hypothetical protein